MADESTLLTITGVGVPPYSARQVGETLEPIDASVDLRRDVNGALDDYSAPQMQKYKITLECTDQDAPALSGVWPGKQVTIGCVSELSFFTAGGSPDRAVVEGSLRSADGFTFYRPLIAFTVTRFSQKLVEWDAEVSWQLEGEET